MSRRSNTTIGLIALAVLAVVVYLGWTKEIPLRSHYEVKAAFETSNNLRTGSPVRIAGVEVGKVTGVERRGPRRRDRDDADRRQGPAVHADATAKIRPRIFLEGNFFVDLTAGTPSAPELDDGATIPVQQTATPVQLDEVLTALQSDTREDLKVAAARVRQGARRAPAPAASTASIPYWEPAYRDTAIVSEAMLGEPATTSPATSTTPARPPRRSTATASRLKSLVTDFHTTAAAFAREEGNLRAAVGELPHTLRAAMPALDALNDAFPPLRALARELRPGVQSSRGRRSTPRCRSCAAARARLRARAARPGRRPAADRARPRGADRRAASRSIARSAAPRAARTT